MQPLITRTVHEWLQKTAMAVNTWSTSAIQLCHHAVSVAKGCTPAVDRDGSCPEGFANWIAFHRPFFAPSTFCPGGHHEGRSREHLPPGPCAVLSHTKARPLTVADLLFLTFMTYLPSEPSARVDGLTDIEAPVRPARTFAEALSFLRSWRQKILTVVNDLGETQNPSNF